MAATGDTHVTSTPRARRLVGVVLVAALLTGGVGFTGTPGHATAPGAGSLDTSFNPGGAGTNFAVRSVALAPDGKVLIGGDFTFYNGVGRNHVARLNADGTLDETFNPGTGANEPVYSVAVQPDGKVLIGGEFTFYNGVGRNHVARLNADGSLDTTFNPGTGAGSLVRSVALAPGGKVLIGGAFTTYNGSERNRIARLNADGTLDVGFTPGAGAAGNPGAQVFSVVALPDGEILIGGSFTTYRGAVRNGIARVESEGENDGNFRPGDGANSQVESVVALPDGKVLIGGDFTAFDGVGRNRIARLNDDGTLDETFNPGTGANGRVHSVAVQSDGKVLIGGAFREYNAVGRNRIARLNADGTLDETFNPGSGPAEPVLSVVPLPDGKVLIGGDFDEYGGTDISGVARLNGDPPPPPPPPPTPTTSTTVAPGPSPTTPTTVTPGPSPTNPTPTTSTTPGPVVPRFTG